MKNFNIYTDFLLTNITSANESIMPLAFVKNDEPINSCLLFELTIPKAEVSV